MKYRCHLCGKIAADIRDASMAKGAVIVCADCIADLRPREKRGNATDSMPPFMSDFFRGMKK